MFVKFTVIVTRSLKLNCVHFLLLLILVLVNMGKAYQPHLYEYNGGPVLSLRLDPRFRHFEPYAGNTTLMTENQVRSDQQRSGYYLPQQPQTATTIDRYRQEGNFYGTPLLYDAETKTADVGMGPIKRYIAPTSLFDHRVFHADTWSTEVPPYYGYWQRRVDDDGLVSPINTRTAQVKTNQQELQLTDERNAENSIAQNKQLRDVQQDQISEDTVDAAAQNFQDDEQSPAPPPLHEIRSFHDIYMRLAGPNDLNLFGHVEHRPQLFEQRFESQNKGNRFKGEVLWADDTGGYGKQYWDLAQGAL